MTELDQFRAAKDAFLRSSPDSPLTPEQQQSFQGLEYFPESPELRLRLRPDPFPERSTIRMQTTTGDVQTYERFGRVRFEVLGEEAGLTIYRNEHGFFLPFVDSLAGKETYGAGRYVEPEEQSDGSLLIDFNLAYNPYCAYNADWSCPITPAENRLKVPIRAGEKVFHEEGS
jgi:uncharacterized protein